MDYFVKIDEYCLEQNNIGTSNCNGFSTIDNIHLYSCISTTVVMFRHFSLRAKQGVLLAYVFNYFQGNFTLIYNKYIFFQFYVHKNMYNFRHYQRNAFNSNCISLFFKSLMKKYLGVCKWDNDPEKSRGELSKYYGNCPCV